VSRKGYINAGIKLYYGTKFKVITMESILNAVCWIISLSIMVLLGILAARCF